MVVGAYDPSSLVPPSTLSKNCFPDKIVPIISYRPQLEPQEVWKGYT